LTCPFGCYGNDGVPKIDQVSFCGKLVVAPAAVIVRSLRAILGASISIKPTGQDGVASSRKYFAFS
jgi:hypothetical protein